MSPDPRCRSCAAASLELIWKHDLPASLASPQHLPIDAAWQLSFCPQCALVQRTDELYADIASGPRTEMPLSVRQLTRQVMTAQKLRSTSLVVEVGSRDGRLLSEYQQSGIPVLGIEPAARLADLARLERGVPTLARRFDTYLAAQMVTCGQPADVVHLHDVLSLVDDPDDMAAGLVIMLKDTGVAVIEVPYVRAMLDRGDLWSLQHASLSFFSLTSLTKLLGRHRLVVHDLDLLANTGTLRVFAGCRGTSCERVETLLAEEQAWGVERLATYLPRRQSKVA